MVNVALSAAIPNPDASSAICPATVGSEAKGSVEGVVKVATAGCTESFLNVNGVAVSVVFGSPSTARKYMSF